MDKFCKRKRQWHLDGLHHNACRGCYNEIPDVSTQLAPVHRPQSAPPFKPHQTGNPGSNDNGSSELEIGLCTYHRFGKLSVSIALELRRPAQSFGCYVALRTG